MQNLKLESNVVSITDLQSLLDLEKSPMVPYVSSYDMDPVTKECLQTQYCELNPIPVQAADPLIRLSETIDRLEEMHKKFSFLMHEVRYGLKLNYPRSK